jgi:hypothetical protein
MFTYLSRISPQTYHLINPNQPEDVCVYEAGQLQQCLAFDSHLRSTQETPISGSILAPVGYKELSGLFNESHDGPERLSTFERQQDGSVRIYTHGPPVTSELLGFESPSLLNGADAPVTEDANDHDPQNEQLEEINTFVMVEMPESADTLSPVRERIDKVKDLAQELSKFYLAR